MQVESGGKWLNGGGAAEGDSQGGYRDPQEEGDKVPRAQETSSERKKRKTQSKY